MTFKQRVNNTWRKGRIFRYQTYKKMGIVRHRKKADLTLLLLFRLCILSFPFFIVPKHVKEPIPEPPSVEEEATEEVHPDLGDEPVVPVQQTSLDEIENL